MQNIAQGKKRFDSIPFYHKFNDRVQYLNVVKGSPPNLKQIFQNRPYLFLHFVFFKFHWNLTFFIISV